VGEEPRLAGPVDIDIDPLDLVDATRFARHGYPHHVWTKLRAEAPVAYIEPPGHPPFWAVTKHEDIVQVATQPLLYSSSQGITLDMDLSGMDVVPEMIVYLDPPRHGPMRKIANQKFTRSSVRERIDEIERIATAVVDLASTGDVDGECDFVDAFAAPFPLAVVGWVLGVPQPDWELLFRWTNEIIGKDDPEYRRPGESPDETSTRARIELHRYFKRMVEDRRNDPQDDLVTQLAQSEIDGVPLTPQQLISYCELLVEAGNQTARDAIAGGLQAFCEHPDQWEKLRAQPELLPSAVEEILRWVTPISYFSRTATEDTELRGQKIRKGDKVALYWASANRDEALFEDPFEFRIDRQPNQHDVFGFGPHLCMGAHVARVEIQSMFGLLARRMEWFEPAGPVERMQSAINGAVKHLPLRYRLT
jgi:cholest-4-en-3-one 26-monooxygenase